MNPPVTEVLFTDTLLNILSLHCTTYLRRLSLSMLNARSEEYDELYWSLVTQHRRLYINLVIIKRVREGLLQNGISGILEVRDGSRVK